MWRIPLSNVERMLLGQQTHNEEVSTGLVEDRLATVTKEAERDLLVAKTLLMLQLHYVIPPTTRPSIYISLMPTPSCRMQ